MGQFDVFLNPAPRARRFYPLMAVMQAALADTEDRRVVAPMVPAADVPEGRNRLLPVVRIDQGSYVVMVPEMRAVSADDLKQPVANLEEARDDLLRAIDWLFFGV